MNRNFFVNPYVKLTVNENPTRFLKIPCNIDNQSFVDYFKIKLSSLFNDLIAEAVYSVKLVYTASNDTITCNIYKENGNDKRFNLKGIIKNNMLYLYFINNGLNSLSYVFARIEQSSNMSYLFENVVEEIPDGYQEITPTEKTIAKGYNVSAIDDTYPIANILKADTFNINCVITLNSTIASGTHLFTGLSGFTGNGIAIDLSDGSIISLKTSGNNLDCNAQMTSGSYLVLANGILS